MRASASHSRRRSEAPDQGCREAAARSGAPAVPARRREPRRADVADRLRHHRRPCRPKARCARCRTSTTGVQAWLFNPNRLAPTYPESAITRPFPFNAYYPEDEAPEVDERRLQARGRRPGRQQEAVDAGASSMRCRRRRRSPATSASRAGARSASGPACGSREFLRRIGADTRAKYVWFQLRRGLFQHHRHGDRAASADAAHASSSTTRSCRASTASR